MCVIAGFVGRGNHNDLKKMIASIKHRGPDDESIFVNDNVGFAHARLSILDLTPAGRQPMFNKGKNIAIVFNGEIYNFQELKKPLIDKGYQFQSKTDTEVIINLYEELGEKCFEKLNGMFAFAIYDFRKNKLILARDRMGKKPLYWSIFDNTFIFGSELKALLAHHLFSKEIDLESVNKYFSYEYVLTPHTIFKNVHKLEPATYLVYQDGKIKKEKFWRPDFTTHYIDLNDALSGLDKKIEESVKIRLISDVPLGIFLSGGLDSSTISYYAQKNSKEKIKTFSIGFKEKSFDESIYARQISDFLGTEHYHHTFTPKDALNLIPKISEIIDEPLADDSIIPTFLLSNFTRQRVTVALGGDGGDELFAGYQTFQAQKLADIYKRIPLSIRKNMIEKIISRLPVSDKYFSIDFKLKKFIEGFYGEKKYTHQRWLGNFSKQEKSQLFNKETWHKLEAKNEFDDIDSYIEEINTLDFNNQMLYLYMRTYMMDRVLTKVDRASMFASLEVRAPFLDFNVVDFVNSLPYEYKIKGLTTKYILKKLMQDKLPKNIVFRSKQGFGLPIGFWLRNDLKDFCNEILSRDNINISGLFHFDYIEKLKQEHFSGKKDNRKKLWSLLIFQLWHEKWLR